MGWKSALRATKQAGFVAHDFSRPSFSLHDVDWEHLVTLDFETYFDDDYTLKKISTSEYIRDPRFKAQMVGIKIGSAPTQWYPAKQVRSAIKRINWKKHDLLCHNTQFDGFILSHHYGVVPRFYYDTLSMARGLHSNEIGASLDEVAKFYGGEGKIEGVLDLTRGVLNWPAELNETAGKYCAQDVDETYRIFKLMHAKYPTDEMRLIDLTLRMFCDPVLKVDLPRVEKEMAREKEERRNLFYGLINPVPFYDDKTVLKSKAERELTGEDRDMLVFKRLLGSNDRFAGILRDFGAEPPVKVSPAWMKRSKEEREATLDDKYTYAFAKDDRKFVELPDNIDSWRGKLNPDKPADMKEILRIQDILARFVKARIMTKSTISLSRAERFLKAGSNGWNLPVGYAYFRAHTGRWGGNNKMNMQNLQRGSELRLSILAAAAHMICVVDSGQIEARVNAWLWDQTDLLDAFSRASAYEDAQGKLPKDKRKTARGDDRDAYCKFASVVYGREITKDDFIERFVGKTCVLGLGYQMGAAKLQITLAKGTTGPAVFLTLEECQRIVTAYRVQNHKIKAGWDKCNEIIEDMALGRQGAWKCLSWEKDTLWLPNGMSLKYPDLRKGINEDNGWEEWTYATGDKRSKIYGGLLCENIVQALARIIIGEQMLTISTKYRVVMTTHDEVVTHPKKAEAEACYGFMMKVMTTPPPWCSDIPLAAEGGFDVNYSK